MADSPLLSKEESSQFTIFGSHFDPKLKRSIGIIVSQIVIENETADTVHGYLADSTGKRLLMVDGIQIAMAKFVLNNTASTDWELGSWLRHGYFTIEKLDREDVVSVRIYVGPADYSIDDGTKTTLQSWIFINPAWYEYHLSSDNETLVQASSSNGSNLIARNLYDPTTYSIRHCTYLLDLYSAYNQCAKLSAKGTLYEMFHEKADTGVTTNLTSTELSGTRSPAPIPSMSGATDDVIELQCHSLLASFGLGDNTMICTANDDTGEVITKALNIAVTDSRAPELRIPAINDIISTNPNEMIINLSVKASEITKPSPSVNCDMSDSSGLAGVLPFRITTIDCSPANTTGESAEAKLFIVRITPGVAAE